MKKGIDVGYVARLACIELTEEERTLFQQQLDEVLRYVEQLEELDVEGVEPTAHATALYNVLRPDEPQPGLRREEVLANAPSVSREQFRVPKIIDQ